jgi:ketosteroid isomerase-like protein
VAPVAKLISTASPEQSTTAFVEAINAADLDAATHCFARDACLVTPDATAITGREAIRLILAQLIDRESQIEVRARSILIAGAVALGSEHWRIRSIGVGGAVFSQAFNPTLVLRHLEGDWKLAIAEPWRG